MRLRKLLFLICLVAHPAAAAEPTPASPAVPLVANGPFLVRVFSDAESLTPNDVRSAVARELGAVALAPEDAGASQARGQIAISYSAARAELAVTYSHPDRGALTRVVPAPATSSEVASTAALLVGNLVRNEAEELLGSAPTLPATPARLPPPAAPPPQPRPAAAPAPVHEAPPPEQIANAGFFYPLATNYGKPNLRTHLDVSLVYGRIGELDGLGLGTVNVVDGNVRGVQLGVVANLVAKRVEGIEAAFLFNHVSADLTGLQVAGVFNRTRGHFEGLQTTAGANLAEGSVLGGQASLFGFNYVGGSVEGLQIAPLANFSSGQVSGLQVALGLNRAGNVSGAQIGLVNIGRTVRGAQIGLLNIADDVDGVPIGLVSVTRTGGVHPVVWASNTTYGNFGLKFATRYTYTMLSASVHETDQARLAGPGFTIGASIPVLPKTAVEIDIQGIHLFANTACCERYFFGAAPRALDRTLAKLRASGRYEFLPHFSAVAGAGIAGRVRYPVEPDGDTDPTVDFGGEIFGGIQL